MLNDLRFSIRSLLKRPLFVLVAVASLALGIGANTTVFSLTREVFLASVPVQELGRLLVVHSIGIESGATGHVSYENWRDFRERNESFAAVTAYEDGVSLSVSIGSEAQELIGMLVTGSYFETLGVEAALGRVLTPADDVHLGAHPVVVVAHHFWSRHLGSDPDTLGKTLHINGHPFTVVGVAPARFKGLTVASHPALWMPMAMHSVVETNLGYSLYEGNRRALMLQVAGRLRDGVSPGRAVAEVRSLGDRLAEEYPEDNSDRTLLAEPLSKTWLPAWFRNQARSMGFLLTSMVALVLLIVCVNLANLLLTRATERRSEIALRLALGIDRRRLFLQLVFESLLLACLGGIAGLFTAWASRSLLVAWLGEMPLPIRPPEMAFDGPIFLFTLVIVLFAGLGFGLMPALQSWNVDLVRGLKGRGEQGGKSRWLRPRNVLVVAQVAFSVVLLLTAGLFLRSVQAAQRIDPGFESERLAILDFNLSHSGYSKERGEGFQRTLVERAEALPGIERAVVVQAAPLEWGWFRSLNLPQESDADRSRRTMSNVVGPGYFAALGIEIEQGRGFEAADDSNPHVAVINRQLAAQLWPDGEALGQRFRLRSSQTDYTLEVVGVAQTVAYERLGQNPEPYAYLPAALEYRPDLKLVVRTASAPGPFLEPLRHLLQELEPDLAVTRSTTVGEVLDGALAGPRATSRLLGAFGALTLALAALGVYGVMSYNVVSRRREIGIRMAVGAQRPGVFGMIFSHSLTLVAWGMASGFALAASAVGFFRSILYVAPTDPSAFLGTAAALFLVAVAATIVPAWRAMAMEPLQVLREE